MYKNKISGIYEIKNVLNNHRYIGSSINIYKRFNEHINALRNNRHHSNYLQRAWNKYGEKHFIFNILEECESIKETLLLIEQKYLDLKPEYNICCFASCSTLGFKHSEETKRKISILHKGKKGKPHTEETKLLMSLLHKGRKVSEETRNKLRKPIFMIDINTGNIIKEFKGMGEAGIFLGNYNRRVEIKRAAQGKRKSAYGYIWKYKIIKDDL